MKGALGAFESKRNALPQIHVSSAAAQLPLRTHECMSRLTVTRFPRSVVPRSDRITCSA